MAENRWPNALTKACIVVGSSRGLGSALVDALLTSGAGLVVGVARTGEQDIAQCSQWSASQRYCHVQTDIGSPESVVAMSSLLPQLPNEPLLLIFNAACLAKDTKEDLSIDFDVFDEVNRTGIDGLRNVLRTYQDHLLTWGGVFVGISSINALMPPVLEHRVAYAATKAYLHMALRCAELAWQGKVSFLTVHLGHVGGATNRGVVSRLLQPTYKETADKILRLVLQPRLSGETAYPFVYNLVYRGVLRFVPDSIYYRLLAFLVRLSHSQ